jgi:proprotein convertase subtilisin/kexin type 5
MVNNKFTLNLPNFTFFYSYEPISFQAAIMSNDLLFNYANGSFATTNQVPSYPSFAFAFTNYELQSSTDLLISNITSGTIAQRIALIQLTFGTDFNISLIDCTNSGFTCSVVDRMVQLRINNLGNFSSFSIKNLITSANSPSTSVAFATYSSTGYLIDQNSIIIWKAACSLPCKTCNSVTTQCLSCYTDQVLAQSRVLYFASNLTCVADCGDLYYRNYTTNVCLSCSSSCANCYNFSYCTSCPSNQYFLASNTSCFQACPTGYFQKSIYCIACTSSLNCYTCTNELTCATCYGRYLSQSQCLLTCPLLTTVPNSINYTCDACPANCSTCQLVSSTVVCLSCSNGLLDNGTCVQSCKNPGYVPNNLICSPCDANCLTCQGSPTFCLSCSNSSGFPYLLSNKCYNTCPNTYYNNNNFYLCMPCISPCETCLNYSSTSCITCLSSFTLLGTNCESTCPTTYYKNGAICSQCVPPCLTCSTLSFCFTCISNYTYFSSNYSCLSQCPQGYVIVNQTCMICSSNCLTCISVTYCSSCHNSSYLLNGYCYNPCPTGYYSDSNSSTCVACLYSCSSCSSVSFCIACTTGYYMQSNNTCISLCSSNQISISGLCQTCNSNCTSCQGSINNCTACISAYLFAPSKNSCYSVCPASLFYYPTNSTCLTSCPSSFYISTDSTTNVRTCISCPSYCTSCISGTQCGGCVSGTYSYTGLCYSSCPPIAPYPFNYICQSCNVVSCQTCSGS